MVKTGMCGGVGVAVGVDVGRLLRGRRWVRARPRTEPVAKTAAHGSCAVVQPGVLDATEEEAAVLRGLREDGAVIEVEEKSSRLVESNGAGVELSTYPAVDVVHGAVDVAGV
jgi:hypothetical protein